MKRLRDRVRELTAWDESSAKAHWRNRPENQPFFSVFNITTTHESQIWPQNYAKHAPLLKPEERHDPSQAKLPPYYPDAPAIRGDWARYYDLITLMDRQAGDLLRQLEEDGLANNTAIFFFSDHGRGLPRAKRWVYDASLHVPLIVRWPGRIAPGTVGSSIAWTTDLSESQRWNLYSRPITLDRNATLRAKACRLGYRDSPEVRAEFKIGEADAISPGSFRRLRAGGVFRTSSAAHP